MTTSNCPRCKSVCYFSNGHCPICGEKLVCEERAHDNIANQLAGSRQFSFYDITFTIDKKVVYRSKEPIQASDACRAVELTVTNKLFEHDEWMLHHRIEAEVSPVDSSMCILVSFKLADQWLTMPKFK